MYKEPKATRQKVFKLSQLSVNLNLDVHCRSVLNLKFCYFCFEIKKPKVFHCFNVKDVESFWLWFG